MTTLGHAGNTVATDGAPGVVADVFAGPGEMAARCRSFDWAATPLGPVAAWPQSLRTTVATMLASRHPMFLWWGPELVQIFNDGYRPSFGTTGRDVAALGARGREHWAEIWPVIGPQIERVMTLGEATWHENQLVPIERNGRLEDVYWTYGYSPVRDDDGTVGGVLVVVQETTAQVEALAERERLLAALELERARLAYVFQQAPTFLAVLRGADHVFELVNEAYYQLVGHRALIGLSVVEAMPEVRGQGFLELLDGVLATGTPFVGREVSIRLARAPGEPPEERFLDFVYLPMVDADGTRSGVIAHGTDVTAHVRARRDQRLARREHVVHGDVGLVIVHRSGVDLGVVQHPVDQAEEVPLAALDPVEVRPLLGRHRPVHAHLHQLRVAADGVERRAQLVRHHGEELALRAVRGLRLTARGMGGDVTADSTPGVGSTFTLTLARA